MSSSDHPVAAEAIAEKKPARGPRDPKMVRVGIYLSLAALVPAIICAAIMGSQPQGTLPTVEWIHKAALGGLLAGFVVILFGVMRFDNVRRRWSPRDEVARPGTASSLPWYTAYMIFLLIATAVISFLALVGLGLIGVLFALMLPLPIFLLAFFSPRRVQPFFVGAAFPALILLILDISAVQGFLVVWYYNPYSGSPILSAWLGLHWVGLLVAPLFGVIGVVAARYLRSLDDAPTQE